jgi:hypothetical protein
LVQAMAGGEGERDHAMDVGTEGRGQAEAEGESEADGDGRVVDAMDLVLEKVTATATTAARSPPAAAGGVSRLLSGVVGVGGGGVRSDFTFPTLAMRRAVMDATIEKLRADHNILQEQGRVET